MAAMKSLEAQKHNEALLACINPGDLIEFPRGAYSHWAVYIGNEMVVHLFGDENYRSNSWIDSGPFLTISGQLFGKGLVKVENFWEVADGCKANINNSKDKKYTPLSKREIVKNALEKIGRVEYNVLFNNCEHFASWCRYGLSKSEQADTFLTGSVVSRAATRLMYGFSRSAKKKKRPQEL